MHKVNGISMVNTKLDVLAKRLKSLDVKIVLTPIYDVCGEGLNRYECGIYGQFSQESSNEQLSYVNYNKWVNIIIFQILITQIGEITLKSHGQPKQIPQIVILTLISTLGNHIEDSSPKL